MFTLRNSSINVKHSEIINKVLRSQTCMLNDKTNNLISIFKFSTSLKHSDKNRDSDGDVQLAYAVYPGEKERIAEDKCKKPLLMLHGLFGAKGNFHSICKQLSKNGRKVIPYDARNHGDSDHRPDMSYSVMADDLVELCQELGLDSPVVLGHSMGGKSAMTAALTKPETMSALVVGDVAPHMSPSISGLKDIAIAMREVKIPAGLSIVKARVQARTQLTSSVQDRPVLEFLLTNLREVSPGVVAWRVNLDALINNMSQLADMFDSEPTPFKKPTLFVFGGNSEHYKHADQGLIRALFPSVDIEVIEGAGHFVHAEKPLEFVEIVNQFMVSQDK